MLARELANEHVSSEGESERERERETVQKQSGTSTRKCTVEDSGRVDGIYRCGREAAFEAKQMRRKGTTSEEGGRDGL
jgi:hypothetical protein